MLFDTPPLWISTAPISRRTSKTICCTVPRPDATVPQTQPFGTPRPIKHGIPPNFHKSPTRPDGRFNGLPADFQALWEHYVTIGRQRGWIGGVTKSQVTTATTTPQPNHNQATTTTSSASKTIPVATLQKTIAQKIKDNKIYIGMQIVH